MLDPLGRAVHVCVFFVVLINPWVINTDVAATGLLWYGAVFRITFVSDCASDVSGVSCFGPSP